MSDLTRDGSGARSAEPAGRIRASIAVACLATLAPAQFGRPPVARSAAPEPPSVLPRQVTWDELASAFDPAYLLPDDLKMSADERGPAVDLARTMRRLASEVYPDKSGVAGVPTCFGDVIVAYRAAHGDVAAGREALARVAKRNPLLWKDLEPWAAELLCDARFRAKGWDPDRDDACDGFAYARPFTLEGRTEKAWKKRDGADLVQQAAVLIEADLEAIKSAEFDFRTFHSRPGANYERVGPVADSYVVGQDPRGAPFSALRFLFESDLPFPFSTFTCDLHVLNRVDAQQRLVCDVYSTSKDFHWLAGRDHYFPVRTSTGAWVATLVVRWSGFDLRGVPDDDGARAGALRSNLGGLKRDAEAAFRAYGGPPRTVEKTWPAFEVHGATQH